MRKNQKLIQIQFNLLVFKIGMRVTFHSKGYEHLGRIVSVESDSFKISNETTGELHDVPAHSPFLKSAEALSA